jgi:hypothetical protein
MGCFPRHIRYTTAAIHLVKRREEIQRKTTHASIFAVILLFNLHHSPIIDVAYI